MAVKLSTLDKAKLTSRAIEVMVTDETLPEDVRAALAELAKRRRIDDFGECWNCAKRKTGCETFFEAMRNHFQLSYCSNKEVARG